MLHAGVLAAEPPALLPGMKRVKETCAPCWPAEARSHGRSVIFCRQSASNQQYKCISMGSSISADILVQPELLVLLLLLSTTAATGKLSMLSCCLRPLLSHKKLPEHV